METVDAAELDAIARAIDAASDAKNVRALQRLDDECSALLVAKKYNSALVHYFRSNVHAGLQEADDPHSWHWRQPHREKQILHLHRAWADPALDDLPRVRRAQIGTNLASQLNSLGRPIEALRLFDSVLAESPHFAMAACNRGLARLTLAHATHDEGHSALLAAYAWKDYVRTLGPDMEWEGVYPEAIEGARQGAEEIERAVDVRGVIEDTDLDDWSVGRSVEERSYRERILRLGLFLNPLNALGPHPIAATDALNLPSYTSKAGEPPQFIAWFNQLKQEFATARLLFHESHAEREHFADRDLRLVDTLDDPVFSIASERLRLAFRSSYGLLDKVAGFLNAYFDLGHAPNKVDLRGVWYDHLTKRRDIHPQLKDRQNLPLRGLFWLSFDVLGDQPQDQEAIAPEALHLNALRNALEHRCVVLRDPHSDAPMGEVETRSLRAFRRDTLQMLQLAHAALLNLSFAMHIEEQVRRNEREGLAAEMPLPTYRR